jgi:hypothetical protein
MPPTSPPFRCPALPAADELLSKKAHKELLQLYEEREAAAVQYLRTVRPGLRVETGALRDPKVRRCSFFREIWS